MRTCEPGCCDSLPAEPGIVPDPTGGECTDCHGTAVTDNPDGSPFGVECRTCRGTGLWQKEDGQ